MIEMLMGEKTMAYKDNTCPNDTCDLCVFFTWGFSLRVNKNVKKKKKCRNRLMQKCVFKGQIE